MNYYQKHKRETSEIIERGMCLDIIKTKVEKDLIYIDVVYAQTDVGVGFYITNEKAYAHDLARAKAFVDGFTYARAVK